MGTDHRPLVLLTGASGYIGGRLLRAIVAGLILYASDSGRLPGSHIPSTGNGRSADCVLLRPFHGLGGAV
jgi:nucleoside-diphosphate-sugar epimerase